MLLTANIFVRVFKLEWQGQRGTAFTIDVKDQQWLITASHLLENYNGGIVRVFHDGKWKYLDCNALKIWDPNEYDVAVLQPTSGILSPKYPVTPTINGLAMSQQAYIVGFPLGLVSDSGELNRDFPFPLVKGCIVSGIMQNKLYLDGHNNFGFSGGPVVFFPSRTNPTSESRLCVAGVVAGYPPVRQPIFDEKGEQSNYYTEENSGFIVAHAIDRAIKYISKGIDEPGVDSV